MTVASEQPHLLGLDEEKFGAGVVLYYLKVCVCVCVCVAIVLLSSSYLSPAPSEWRHHHRE